jgi:hypothetical protein
VPIITKREFEAIIGVKSRETIALGGLVRTARRQSRTKVPLLGDLPLLGAFFRSDALEDERTELMVLITPYVVMTEEEATAETRRLYDATGLRKSKWERGWSDSELTTPPKSRRGEDDRKQVEWTLGEFNEVDPLAAKDEGGEAGLSEREPQLRTISSPQAPDLDEIPVTLDQSLLDEPVPM